MPLNFTSKDELSEMFGGHCNVTGEPMVDLNILDSSLEGCVTASEASRLFSHAGMQTSARDDAAPISPADGVGG